MQTHQLKLGELKRLDMNAGHLDVEVFCTEYYPDVHVQVINNLDCDPVCLEECPVGILLTVSASELQ